MGDIYDEIVPTLNHLYLNFFTVQKMLFSRAGRKQNHDYDKLYSEAIENFDNVHELYGKYKNENLNPLLFGRFGRLK